MFVDECMDLEMGMGIDAALKCYRAVFMRLYCAFVSMRRVIGILTQVVEVASLLVNNSTCAMDCAF